MLKFEDKIAEINCEILKRKNKWQLNAISYMDFDDVSQIIRIHIYKQWSKWNQEMPFLNWVNVIITNKIINIVRDNYSKLAPPCNGCPSNIGGNSCSFTKSGERCAECPLYKEWEKKKKTAYNLKLAASSDTEFYIEPKESSTNFSESIDYEACAAKIHFFIKQKLTSAQWRIYEMLIIKGMSEEEVAVILGLKSNEHKRSSGYRHFAEMRKIYSKFAKEVIEEQDILM
jgi:DNA-directed RNA polymerase specialized sigma24 family protein